MFRIIRIMQRAELPHEILRHQKRYFVRWLEKAGIRLSFNRVMNALHEVDISLKERAELELRVHGLNEDNEDIG